MSTPRSHRDDPSTSREAARRKAESGTVDSDKLLLGLLVCANPGSTIPELAQILFNEGGSDFESCRQRLGRRASELSRANVIHAKGKRDGCQLWWPGPAPEDAKQAEMFEPPRAAWRVD